jgi:D-serine deaminase-like pyridoxal phosphate-dependent protein
VKTHKIPDIAKDQLEAGAEGITVAKLSQAEVMADAGIKDIFITYPLVTDAKIRRAVRLDKKVRLVVGLDSLEGARRLSVVAKAEDHILVSQAGGGHWLEAYGGPVRRGCRARPSD